MLRAERSAVPPFTLGAVVGRTFSTWGRNLLPFAVVSFVVHVPSLLATIAIGPLRPSSGLANLSLPFWLNTLFASLLSIISTGALTHGVLEHLRGRRATVGQMFRVGLARLGPVLLVALATGILILLSLSCFVFPAAVVGCMLFVAVPAAVVEPGIGVAGALGRSRQLTSGHRWAIFLLGILVYLTTLVFGTPMALLGLTNVLPHPLTALATQLLAALASPLWSVAGAVAYHDLRVAKEGVATEDLVAVFA
jgi:hypothetical protein